MPNNRLYADTVRAYDESSALYSSQWLEQSARTRNSNSKKNYKIKLIIV